MARYKQIDTRPRFIAVDLERQLLPGIRQAQHSVCIFAGWIQEDRGSGIAKVYPLLKLKRGGFNDQVQKVGAGGTAAADWKQ